jgi:Mn2+/Fe2+ NRAMP family transporter
MGVLVNSRLTTFLASLVTVIILCLNVYLLVLTIKGI